jgi:glyoxylase I family protein
MAQQTSSQENAPGVINAVHGFRYQVKDVARAVAFYTKRLGFTLKHQQLPAFANVSLGGADVWPASPSSSAPTSPFATRWR